MLKIASKHIVTSTAAIIGVSLALSGTALAFGGCVDSPENPTWILAMIGGAAAGIPWLKAKIKDHRSHS